MKIATWNVNSLNIRMPQMIVWLEDKDIDVICLQETKTVDENFPVEAIRELGYEAAFLGQKSYNGVAILSKHPIEDVHKNFFDDDEDSPKRMIAATIIDERRSLVAPSWLQNSFRPSSRSSTKVSPWSGSAERG